MEIKINKAQEKRDRQNTEFINSDLRRKLAKFENKYLNGAVAYEFNIRKAAIQKFEKLIAEFPMRVITKENQRTTVADYEGRIKRVQKELELDATIILNTITDAKKSYDEKVNRLVSLLVAEGFGYAHYKVEEIRTKCGQLEFLISKSDKEVHARLIYVEGVIVTPHFRFITTTRKIG